MKVLLLLLLLVFDCLADTSPDWIQQKQKELSNLIHTQLTDNANFNKIYNLKSAMDQGKIFAKQIQTEQLNYSKKLSQGIRALSNPSIDKLLVHYKSLEQGIFTFEQSCQPLIFISFAMPVQSLKQWVQQAKQMNATLVIRGLVQNSFNETFKTLKNFQDKVQVGIQLDPTLFRRFSIEKAPAVVMAANQISAAIPSKRFDIVYGDIPLKLAMEIIAEQGTVCADIAKQLLAKKEML